MKHIFTSMLRRTAAAAAMLLAPVALMAQMDMGDLAGYANVFVRAQVVSEGSGTVSLTPPAGGLENYKQTVDFKRTLPVPTGLDIVYFNAKVRPATGYIFGGWYLDDGDGTFDIEKDELLDINGETLLFLTLDKIGLTLDDLYATETEAKLAEQPAKPQATLFAMFTNGAIISYDYRMNYFGTIEIDKPVNSVGDVVTIKATPFDGYQFEYWKTGYDSQWGLENPNTVVSRDAEYTFTVEGGEHYYAYFSSVNAPVLQFPEEGGWMAAAFDGAWVMHELSDAFVYMPSIKNDEGKVDIITKDGRTYFDMDDEEAKYDNTRHFISSDRWTGRNRGTLIYGRGTVRFLYNTSGLFYDYDRANNLIEWSGTKPYTINDANHTYNFHVYAFRPDAEAFMEIGTTDEWEDVYTSSVTVPANTCYVCLEALDIADPVTGEVPHIIAMSPEAYDRTVSGVYDVRRPSSPSSQCYDLQGRRIDASALKSGLYIRSGRKQIVK